MNATTTLRRFDSVPVELRESRRWLVWRYKLESQKWKKRPLNDDWNDRATWLSFDDAVEVLEREDADGVGFILGDGIVGLDFDDCVGDDGEFHPAVRRAIATLGSYAERSPSKRGVHILLHGKIERGRKLGATADLPQREIYSDGHYFTFTGERLTDVTVLVNCQADLDVIVAEMFPDCEVAVAAGEPEQPSPIWRSLSDDKVLELLHRARNAPKFETLYSGDWRNGGYPTQSEADAALCAVLCFYTRDPLQIDRLFRHSGLFRAKWDERRGRQTYGQRTIGFALRTGGRPFDPTNIGHKHATPQAPPAWWNEALKACTKTAIRLADLLLWYSDATGHCGRLSTWAFETELDVAKRTVENAVRQLKTVGVISTVGPGGAPKVIYLALHHAVSPMRCNVAAQNGDAIYTQVEGVKGKPEFIKRLTSKKLGNRIDLKRSDE